MATRPAPPVPGGRQNSRSSSRSSNSSRVPHQKPRIGQYIIEKTLGSGSFGKVKLATHSVTGHQVALKFVSRAKIDSSDTNARVKREIQYLKLLRHPHIIKLYEVVTTATDVIMVMEYAGEELFNYIVTRGKGGMSEDEARRFFQQMIAAIEYCHRHQIVHRDLKPENLLLDSRRNIKIADFGLSNLMTDGDFLKTSCGSPNYAAPEVISGRLYSGPEIDVWSAGVIVYVLLCGKLPFDDDHIPSLFKKIESGHFHLPVHLSDGARHLLRRMLHTDPLKRATIAEIRTMSFFQENLPRYLEPLPEMEAYPTLPMDDLSTLLLVNEGQADPRKVAEAKGLRFTEDLGILDPEIVEELLDRVSTYTEDMVWNSLQRSGDNQVKVAYQLVRDHKRILKDSLNAGVDEEDSAMEEFMASSPPAWYSHMPRHPSAIAEEAEDEWDDPDGIQDIPNAHFDVLDSSLPGFEETPGSEEEQQLAERAARALLPGFRPHDKPLTKPKWHFGIRSRSPPMEVMLEIYKTLAALGMQWKRKEGIGMPEIGPATAEGYPEEVLVAMNQWAAIHGEPPIMGKKKPPKAETQAQDKAAANLYMVETRARYGDIIVRMDLQLYRVEGLMNFLVDFRNIGYYHTTDTSIPEARIPSSASSSPGQPAGSTPPSAPASHVASASLGSGIHPSSTSGSLGAAAAAAGVNGSGMKMAMPPGQGGVSGPFHFLEMACQLIAELANPQPN